MSPTPWGASGKLWQGEQGAGRVLQRALQVHTNICVAVKTVLISDAIVVARKRCCGAEARAKDAKSCGLVHAGRGERIPQLP